MCTEITPAVETGAAVNKLLGFSDLCSITGLRVKDLKRYCDSGAGPRAVVIAGYIRYRTEDVVRWLEQLAQQNTAEEAEDANPI